MKILVHDYAGHPFQVQLSRELARRGHQVLHLYAGSIVTPRGALAKTASDPETLRIDGIFLDSQIDKSTYIRRFLQERDYGTRLADAILAYAPDIVLSANTPLDAQSRALKAAQKARAAFVFWVQDIYSVALSSILGRKFGLAGKLVGWHYTRIEQALLRASDAAVVISEDFARFLADWGIPQRKLTTIPNWASREELPAGNKDNAWSRLHGLSDTFCFVYSGTLGMKHNPELLVQVAARFSRTRNVKVLVVSEGPGANYIKGRASELGLDNLSVLPFQQYEELPNVLASADVLLAILEPEAGVFSVPSKVLSYLCAARPLLLAIPAENLAAKLVTSTGAGLVVPPGDSVGFSDMAERLYSDPAMRESMAQKALEYATEHFDLAAICGRFEHLFYNSMNGRNK